MIIRSRGSILHSWIGKERHNDCEVKKITGKCVMPTEGIFAVVERGGTVRKGDKIPVAEVES